MNRLLAFALAIASFVGAASAQQARPALVSAHVVKSGTLVAFGACRATPAPNGGHPLAPITAVKGTPTVYCNGKRVAIGAPAWFPQTKDTPLVFYRLDCGSVRDVAIADGGAGYLAPVVKWNGDGGGKDLVLGRPVLKTGVVGYKVTNGGTGYKSARVDVSPPPGFNVGPDATVAPQAKARLKGGAVTEIVPLAGGLLACGSGYDAAHPPAVKISGDGTGATATAVVSTYIAYVPVVSSSGDFASPPTFTISDEAATRPAVLQAIMGGVSPSDALTYDAPANWMTPTIGGLSLAVTAVAGRPIDNWTGRLEGVSGGFGAFAQRPVLVAGVNVGAQPSSAGFPMSTIKNRFRNGRGWEGAGTKPGKLTTDRGGTPISWTDPSTTTWRRWCHGPMGRNQLDGMGWAGQRGRWTLRYNDSSANTPSAMAIWMTTRQGWAPVNLSGPHLDTRTPAVVAPRDIVVVKGGVTVPSLGRSRLGAGYSGALVQVTGGGGSGAVLTAQVDPRTGTIARITTVCPGANYGAGTKVLIYGTALSGTTVTSQYDSWMPAGATSWAVDAMVHMAAPAGPRGLGYWTASDVRLVAPDARTGAATPIPPGEGPLATEDNMIRALTADNGKAAGILRFMDATAGYGGASNDVSPSHLIDPDAMDWAIQRKLACRFVAARAINTDPKDTACRWSSPKIYGPQALFSEGPDAFGKYLSLPPGDSGRWTVGWGGQVCLALELRSKTPHPFTTGQTVEVWVESGGVGVPFTNTTRPYAPVLASSPAWVTGPYTIAVSLYAPDMLKPGVKPGNAPQRVASTAEIDLTAGGRLPGWGAVTTIPTGGGCVPFRYPATMASQLPGSTLWVNLPPAGSDAYVAEVAREVARGIGPSNRVLLEWSNEVWNGMSPVGQIATSWCRLLGDVPAGTTVLGKYVSTGSVPPYDVYGGAVPVADHAFDAFEAAWKGLGLDPSRVERCHGSWYNGPYRTQQILALAQQSGMNVDRIAIGPYHVLPGDGPIVAAFSAAGTRPDAGSWTVASINDLYRHWMAYSAANQGYWRGHALACRALGQPLMSSNMTVVGQTGGHLAGGTYHASFTFEDAEGRETTVGLSRSQFPIQSGQVAAVTTPCLPPWATRLNLYVGDGAAGTETHYRQIPRGQCIPGAAIRLGAARPASKRIPPTTNLAALHAPPPPTLICYEGGAMTAVPEGVPFRLRLLHDCFAHPSAREVIYGWYAAAQLGDQTLANSGATHAAYYQLLEGVGYPAMWVLQYGAGQLPGDGSKNRYATIQGGFPADGHDHNGGPDANDSPALQGLRDWIGEAPAAPTVAPREPASTIRSGKGAA